MKHGAAATDTDGDGMPDAWEDAHTLNRKDRRDHAQKMRSGYFAIEEYLNERAQALTVPTQQ